MKLKYLKCVFIKKCYYLKCYLVFCLSLQSFPVLSATPSVKDWSGTNVATDVCIGMIRRSVSKLETTLEEIIDKLSDSGREF